MILFQWDFTHSEAKNRCSVILMISLILPNASQSSIWRCTNELHKRGPYMVMYRFGMLNVKYSIVHTTRSQSKTWKSHKTKIFVFMLMDRNGAVYFPATQHDCQSSGFQWNIFFRVSGLFPVFCQNKEKTVCFHARHNIFWP